MLSEQILRALLRLAIAACRFWLRLPSTAHATKRSVEDFEHSLTHVEEVANNYVSSAGAL